MVAEDNISPSGPREYLESPKDVEEACLYESEEDTDEEWLFTSHQKVFISLLSCMPLLPRYCIK
jgi:hypothetical protein